MTDDATFLEQLAAELRSTQRRLDAAEGRALEELLGPGTPARSGLDLAMPSIEPRASVLPVDALVLTNGLYNGDMHAPPTDLTAHVGPLNALPYWSLTKASGTAIDLDVIADATQPRGYRWRFSMASGAAGDETYIEQIVPVQGSRNRSYSYAVWMLTTTTDGTINFPHGLVFVRGQYLDTLGATIGTEVEFSGASSAFVNLADVGGTFEAQVPATAAYLRVRVGMKRNTAINAHVCQYDIYDIRLYPVPDRLQVADQNSNIGSSSSFKPALISSTDGVVAIDAEKSIWLRNPVRPFAAPTAALASADVALTTTNQDLTGATFTATPDVDETWEISMVVDFDVTVAGVGVCVADLLVDGVAQSGSANFGPASTGRATVAQGPFFVAAAAGVSTTAKIQVRKTINAGTASARLTHSRITVHRWARVSGGGSPRAHR